MGWFSSKAEAPTHRDCAECGASVNMLHLQRVKSGFLALYYCEAHRVPYDEVQVSGWTSEGPSDPVYYRKMRVSKDGVPVGFRRARR